MWNVWQFRVWIYVLTCQHRRMNVYIFKAALLSHRSIVTMNWTLSITTTFVTSWKVPSNSNMRFLFFIFMFDLFLNTCTLNSELIPSNQHEKNFHEFCIIFLWFAIKFRLKIWNLCVISAFTCSSFKCHQTFRIKKLSCVHACYKLLWF